LGLVLDENSSVKADLAYGGKSVVRPAPENRLIGLGDQMSDGWSPELASIARPGTIFVRPASPSFTSAAMHLTG